MAPEGAKGRFGCFYRDADFHIWRKIHNGGFDWLDTGCGRTTNEYGPHLPIVLVLDPTGMEK